MTTIRFILAAALATAAAGVSAQGVPTVPSQGAATAPVSPGATPSLQKPLPVPPPRSNLGKQVAPVSVAQAEVVIPRVRPKPKDVVEDSIIDIEDSQLTDDQYERIKKLYLRRERQKAVPYVVPPKPITRTLMVNLDPGISPPVLRLTRGQLTSIVFSDNDGNPWLIKDVGLNRQLFSDGREGAGASQVEATNVLTVEPLAAAAYGNVTIKLKGLSTPVIFVLTAAQQEVDMRIDSKVPGRNPDSPDTVSYTTLPAIDPSLTGFLDGVPPPDARRLRTTGLANTEAWLHQNNLYVRTHADVQYPAYHSSARSTSGKAVYRFNARQNSVTLLSGGRAATVFIED